MLTVQGGGTLKDLRRLAEEWRADLDALRARRRRGPHEERFVTQR